MSKKNCELFRSEEALNKAWERRKELTGVTDDSGFMKWACFGEPDYALLPMYAPGKLLKLDGKYVMAKAPHSNKEGPDRVFNQILYIESNGNVTNNWVTDDRFQPADIPEEILGIVRTQILEEMQSACPLVKCSRKKGKDKQ